MHISILTEKKCLLSITNLKSIDFFHAEQTLETKHLNNLILLNCNHTLTTISPSEIQYLNDLIEFDNNISSIFSKKRYI